MREVKEVTEVVEQNVKTKFGYIDSIGSLTRECTFLYRIEWQGLHDP